MQRREGELVAQCRAVAGEKGKRLAAQREALQGSAEGMRAGCAFAQEALDQGAAAPAQTLRARVRLLGDLQRIRERPLALAPLESARLAFVDGAAGGGGGGTREAFARQLAAYGDVTGAATMAANCTAEGAGLANAKVGIAASFTVQAVDYSGEARAEGGDRVEVEVAVGGGGGEGPAAAADVTDNGDGTYLCAYTAAAEGAALLHVRVCGEAVRGSPFKLAVGPAAGNCPDLAFDPARKGAPDGVLSNGNRTMTGGSGHWSTVLSTESFAEGRHFWEVRVDRTGHNSYTFFGIARDGIAVGTNTLHNQSAHAYSVKGSGGPYGTVDGTNANFVPALAGIAAAAGVTIGLLLDLDANELSVFYNKQFKGKTAIAPGPYRAGVSVVHDSAVTPQHGTDWPAGA